MSGKEPLNSTELSKTSAVISFTNLFMSPFYPRLGLAPSLVLVAAGLYGLHEIGRYQQSGWLNFFSLQLSPEKLTPVAVTQNIFSGGAHVFDTVTQRK